jgi:hypothetical protein
MTAKSAQTIKADKRAAALRDNLRKRKLKKKSEPKSRELKNDAKS